MMKDTELEMMEDTELEMIEDTELEMVEGTELEKPSCSRRGRTPTKSAHQSAPPQKSAHRLARRGRTPRQDKPMNLRTGAAWEKVAAADGGGRASAGAVRRPALACHAKA